MIGDFSEFKTGWRVVLAGLAGTILGAPGLAYYSIGMFAPKMAAEFHWSFAFILSPLALLSFAFLPLGPAVGYLADRFGARLVGAVSLAMFGVGYMSLALSTGSVVQYWASWGMIAIFGAGATPIISTRAVNTLFRKRRGLALGITLMGSGLLLLVLKLFGQAVIDAIGWRAGIAVLGALPLLIASPATIWGFPGKSGLVKVEPSLSGEEKAKPPVVIEGVDVRSALIGWRFWVIAFAFLPVAFAGAAPIPNLENILRSDGVPAHAVSSITPLVGLALILGRLCGGWVIDRVWAPIVTCVIAECGALACFLLSRSMISHQEGLAAALLLGLTAGVELDLLAYTVARYMGMKAYGVIYGILYALFFIAAGLGPSFMARSFDRTGSYAEVMLQASGAMVLAGLLILTLGRYPGRSPSRGVDLAAPEVLA